MADANPCLVAMMPVRNEEQRFLREVLQELSLLVDKIIVLDDASTDGTPQLVQAFPKAELHQNPTPLFYTDEAALRLRLWELATAYQPQWVLALDADEIFEPRARQEIPRLLKSDYDVVAFRLFDFWLSRTHYRVDGLWNPWPRFTPLLVRYFPGRAYTWSPKPFHCGRLPREYQDPTLRVFQSDLRVQHLGWVRPEDQARKYAAYKARDPEGRYAAATHLASVLDPPEKVKLETWHEVKARSF